MKLVKAQVLNFRSVEDSGVFELGDLTCLVGKNEAGKTAILRAIQGIKPTDGFAYDRTRDYPRRHLNKFDERHPNGESPVARTWWTLDDDDMAAPQRRQRVDELAEVDHGGRRSAGVGKGGHASHDSEADAILTPE